MQEAGRRGRSGRGVELSWRLDGAAQSPDAALIISLHGFGMNEDAFARLLHSAFSLPAWFLTLRAPIAASGINEAKGASWYDYDGDQQRFLVELARIEETLLGAVVEAEAELGLRPRARYLLGFSQGGYAGAVIALRHPERFRGMIISGARVKHEVLGPEMERAAAAGFEALLLHGERDASVALDGAKAGEAALHAAGLSVQLHTFPSGHSLGRAQVAVIRDWLLPRIA
ncbi:MAG: hypothetical protein U0527_04075 [Candidatus Eisenbacteria bacterium]